MLRSVAVTVVKPGTLSVLGRHWPTRAMLKNFQRDYPHIRMSLSTPMQTYEF